MARKATLQFFRGTKANLPGLNIGEPGFCTDTNELYIGTATGNVRVGVIKITADMVTVTVPDDSGGDVGDGGKTTKEIALDALLTQYSDEISEALQSVAEHAAELQLLVKPNYAVCSTASGTAAKTVSITPFVLEVGGMVTVKFTNANTAAGASLNVSSSGAKPIMYKGQPLKAGLLSGVQLFSYDGAYWNVVGDFDTNTDTTYSIMTVAEATAGSSITARTVNASNLNQIVTEISTDIVTAELANSYDVSGLQAQLNDLIFQLAVQGILDGSGLDTVVTIDAASDIVLVSGIYASGKVYI